MYFHIRNNNNFFELPNIKKGVDEEYFKKNYDMLYLIKELTEKINEAIKELEI